MRLPKQTSHGTTDARRGSLVLERIPTPPKGIPVQPEPQPGPDGLYRDCVIRLRHLDLLSRPIYVALNADACELDRMVAVSPEHTEKVLARLWDLVYRSRENHVRLMR